MHLPGSYRNSIGSSIVTMCACRVSLMWRSIAAIVVVLPLPVAPVTSTRPRRASAISARTGGRFSSAKVFTWIGMRRITMPTDAALAEDRRAEPAAPRRASSDTSISPNGR